MGKWACDWQETKYVLSYFGQGRLNGRKNYHRYVREGLVRPELVGGGLIRSHGGWSEVKKLRRTGQDRMKGDERILGDDDFVMDVLSEANERMDRRYELKSRGYGIEKLEERVLAIYRIDRDELYSKSRQKVRADARSVFCYWAVRELGVAGTQMAKRLRMSQPGIAYAVKKGERIVRDENLRI